MLRTSVAIALGCAAGCFAAAAGTAVTGSLVGGVIIGVVVAGLVVLLVQKRRVLWLDAAACPRWLGVGSGVATLVALVILARLTVFTLQPSRDGYSTNPASRFEVEHSCTSAYFVAAEVSKSVPNIYDNTLYSAPDDDPSQVRKPRRIGLFRVDVFEYPPQFLLLPWVLRFVTPEFDPFRLLWFGLSGAVFLLGHVVVARFLGAAAGTCALLLVPFAWLYVPLTTLQKGNVQMMFIAATMMAMVLFERRRWATGGALLAFATVSKLFPGLLVVYLLARRQWRSVIWTSAFMGVFSVLTFLLFGQQPYVAFLDHLPKLMSGEAFPAFRNPAAAAVNFSIPGMVFKLKLFGLAGSSFEAAKLVGWAYSLVAVVVTILVGRRTLRDNEKPLVWLSILILATLRSPFLPTAYAALPALWLLTLLAATGESRMNVPAVFLLVWAALNVYWPVDWPMDPRMLSAIIAVPQTAMVLLAVQVLRGRVELPGRRARPALAETAPRAAS